MYINDKKTIYQVSNIGNIRNSKNIKNRKCGLLKPRYNKSNGYIQTCIRFENEKYYRYIHRLVAEAFIPNPDNLPQVNHIDGDKHNNRVENLEWCDGEYNMRHCFDNCLCSTAKKIKVYSLSGKYINTYKSITEAFKDLNISSSEKLNSDVFYDNTKQNQGYQWRLYDSELEVKNLIDKCKMFSKGVVKLTLEGEYICEYKTLNSAYVDLGRRDNGDISRVCKGKQKTAYGFKWVYKSDYNK